jgi:purine-binding chemotaxis protein CheW
MADSHQPTIGLEQDTLEIIAFRLNGQEFCVTTTTIREIRGWSPSTPLPHSPAEVLGVMNLRGSVIPIIDLSRKLGMPPTTPNERSAIVVADVHKTVIGLLVDQVSDILTVQGTQIQPVPDIAASYDRSFSDGIIALNSGMICFLNLARMFGPVDIPAAA